jgi:hypothetical protein
VQNNPTLSRRASSTWLWVQSGSDAFAGLSSLSLTVTAGFGGFLPNLLSADYVPRQIASTDPSGSIEDLDQAILPASLKLKHPGAHTCPAPDHQHCGGDIHKSQDHDQHRQKAGNYLRPLIYVFWTVEVKAGGNYRIIPQHNPYDDCHRISLKLQMRGAPVHLEALVIVWDLQRGFVPAG